MMFLVYRAVTWLVTLLCIVLIWLYERRMK